jgi:hypothetical protein
MEELLFPELAAELFSNIRRLLLDLQLLPPPPPPPREVVPLFHFSNGKGCFESLSKSIYTSIRSVQVLLEVEFEELVAILLFCVVDFLCLLLS